MLNVLVSSWFALALSLDHHRMQTYLDSHQARTDGGAYIVKTFYLDNYEFALESVQQNSVDAFLWYPSGRVFVRFKNKMTSFLGQGQPLNSSKDLQEVIFYMPAKTRLKIKEEIFSLQETNRNLQFKARLQVPGLEPIFLETQTTQILQDNVWVTP